MSIGPENETGPVQAPPVFLEKQSYRRRRLSDAARLLPIFGALLFAVPLLWPDGSGDGDPVPMSVAITYIFGIWVLLIVVGGLFGLAARRWSGPDPGRSERG
ncbi:hypothetical protein M3P21_07890 [Ruegeria sp. 2012CJ41-6]|uniref:Uncharacterized protein n=1 Tax=Ruegeria spongiae TaxID=2942209 RepID=A0ABT0Q0T3_9RHOB|nr:hypothetical protein [Ruegeria spongiae]MCL6283454.1 hypothetical protein [Ruegeria spongiae]